MLEREWQYAPAAAILRVWPALWKKRKKREGGAPINNIVILPKGWFNINILKTITRYKVKNMLI